DTTVTTPRDDVFIFYHNNKVSPDEQNSKLQAEITELPIDKNTELLARIIELERLAKENEERFAKEKS
ncbi:10306_t:CDS:2, partial [Diversispora eburnea]